MKQFWVFFMLLVAIFSLSLTGNTNKDAGEYIHLNQMDIRFKDTSAQLTLHYDLDTFSKAYVLLLGSYNLKPALESLLFDFEQVHFDEIGKDYAIVHVSNISRQSSGYYLHDAHVLGSRVDTLVIVYPDGSKKSMTGATSTPNTFYGG